MYGNPAEAYFKYQENLYSIVKEPPPHILNLYFEGLQSQHYVKWYAYSSSSCPHPTLQAALLHFVWLLYLSYLEESHRLSKVKPLLILKTKRKNCKVECKRLSGHHM
jgi:hypothetical protein